MCFKALFVALLLFSHTAGQTANIRAITDAPAFIGYRSDDPGLSFAVREVPDDQDVASIQAALQFYRLFETNPAAAQTAAIAALNVSNAFMAVVGEIPACTLSDTNPICVRFGREYEVRLPDGSVQSLPSVSPPAEPTLADLAVTGTNISLTLSWTSIESTDPVETLSLTVIRLGGADLADAEALCLNSSTDDPDSQPMPPTATSLSANDLAPSSTFCMMLHVTSVHQDTHKYLVGRTSPGRFTEPLQNLAFTPFDNRLSTRWRIPLPLPGELISVIRQVVPLDPGVQGYTIDSPVGTGRSPVATTPLPDELTIRFFNLLPLQCYNFSVTPVTSIAGSLPSPPFTVCMEEPQFSVPDETPTPIAEQIPDDPSRVLLVWKAFDEFVTRTVREYELVQGSTGNNLGIRIAATQTPNFTMPVKEFLSNPNIRVRATVISPTGQEFQTPLSQPAVNLVDTDLVPSTKRTDNRPLAIGLGVLAGALLLALLLAVYLHRKRRANNRPLQIPAPDEWELERKQLKIGKTIDRGAFGVVAEGTIKDAAGGLRQFNKVAVKMCVQDANKWADVSSAEAIIHEAQILKKISKETRPHPNIVHLVGVCMQEEPLLLILGYCLHGNLQTYLRKRRSANPHNQTHSLHELLVHCADVASGLSFLHEQHVLHCDLSAKNCLVDENHVVKISDFGLSVDVHLIEYYRRQGDTPLPVRWIAPECLSDGLFTRGSDVWSLGVVMWEVFTFGALPYHNLNREAVCEALLSGFHLQQPRLCPESVYNVVIEPCFSSERPTANQVYQAIVSYAEATSNLAKPVDITPMKFDGIAVPIRDDEPPLPARNDSNYMRISFTGSSKPRQNRRRSDSAPVPFIMKRSRSSPLPPSSEESLKLPSSLERLIGHASGLSRQVSSSDNQGNKVIRPRQSPLTITYDVNERITVVTDSSDINRASSVV